MSHCFRTLKIPLDFIYKRTGKVTSSIDTITTRTSDILGIPLTYVRFGIERIYIADFQNEEEIAIFILKYGHEIEIQ